MPDMEKVIKELQHIADWLHEAVLIDARVKEQAVLEAIYLLKEQEHKDRMFHALEDDWKRLKELLKEREPVKPEWRKGTPFCGNCGHRLEKKNRNMDGCKCPNCKKAVRWDV